MADNPNPRPAKPKRRRRALHLEFREYVIAITGWQWGYSLSLDTSRERTEPYHEFKHLVIKGTLLKPLELKVDQAAITLLPSRHLDEERRRNHEPIFMGSLEVDNNKLAGLIPIPMEALPPILQMLIGDRFKFLAMSGTELYRRSTRLTGFRLEMIMDDEESEPSDVGQ